MKEVKKAYPLQWPIGHKRTNDRIYSRFKQTPGDAQEFLRTEMNRLGACDFIVSSNARLRHDGSMYADAMHMLEDPGVAVYFNYKGREVVLCCDTYNRVWENVYAIGKTIENLRAIERYGVSDFLERSFTGFTALPEAIETPYLKPWYEILGVPENATAEEIKKAYRVKAESAHPDKGGSEIEFIELTRARDQGLSRFE